MSSTFPKLPAAALALALAIPAVAQDTQDTQHREAPSRTPDVVFVPTPMPVVEAMLDTADVGPDDVVYDLGCGDGRIAVEAAKRGAKKAVCVDIDPERIQEARARAKEEGVEDRVQFIEGDLFEVDMKDASVVTLYLLPELNQRLMPKLKQLRPGTRVVSHAFDMGDWQPEQSFEVEKKRVYAWTIGGKGKSQARTPPR